MTQPKTASKFTPGPYEVVRLHDGGVGVAKRGVGTVIATFHDYVEHENGQEARPNARFYAKAPRMYKLLEQIIFESEDENDLLALQGMARRIKAEIDGVE